MPHATQYRDQEWRRARAEDLRAKLILELGGKCCECGSTKNLEFNHKYERTWKANNLHQYTRMLRYWKEHMCGMIDLRCHVCNNKYKPLPLTQSNFPF